jgi:uncharacterized lipoprotein YbaY
MLRWDRLKSGAGIDDAGRSAEHRFMGPTRRKLVCGVMLAASMVAGCSRGPSEISGTAAYDVATPLPPDAVLEISLQEVSPGQATATTLGVSRVAALKASPVAFTLPYEAGRIADDREYAVQARVVAGDVVLATSGLQPVLTGGHGARVALTLRQANRALAAAPLVKGMFVGGGEGPRFTPCGEERTIGVDAGGDFAALQSAYLDARRSQGERLLARVEGSIGGDPPALSVTRFVSIALDQTCESP